MTKRFIGFSTVNRWAAIARSFLLDYGLTPASLTNGGEAWAVAHKCGFVREAYDTGANDAHIQTALGAIFPNVVFKDKKRY